MAGWNTCPTLGCDLPRIAGSDYCAEHDAEARERDAAIAAVGQRMGETVREIAPEATAIATEVAVGAVAGETAGRVAGEAVRRIGK